MSRAQCEVCGETKLDGWSYCPACGHPYPEADAAPDPDDDGWDDDPDDKDDEDDEDDDEDDDDDGTLDD